jgi:hypothetical protein
MFDLGIEPNEKQQKVESVQTNPPTDPTTTKFYETVELPPVQKPSATLVGGRFRFSMPPPVTIVPNPATGWTSEWNDYEKTTATSGRKKNNDRVIGKHKNQQDLVVIQSSQFSKLNNLTTQQKQTAGNNQIDSDVATHEGKQFANFVIATQANIQGQKNAQKNAEEKMKSLPSSYVVLILAGIALFGFVVYYAYKTNVEWYKNAANVAAEAIKKL